jgi:hypothetical protein
MNAQYTDIAAVAAAIRRYLREHPNAADTLEGIARWWLSGNSGNELLTDVERALEELVAGGEVVRQTLRDGTVIFERNKHFDPS